MGSGCMWVQGAWPAASEESCDPHQQTWVEPSLPHSPELSGGTASALNQIVSFAAGVGGTDQYVTSDCAQCSKWQPRGATRASGWEDRAERLGRGR